MRTLTALATLLGLSATAVGHLPRTGNQQPPPHAQQTGEGKKGRVDCQFAAEYPPQYVSYYTATPPTIDGRLDEPVWQEVPWTTDFADISGPGFPVPRFRTRAKIRWDDRFLYVAGELEEPTVWANLTQRNSVIFADNDFEVFINPDGTSHYYKEFEMNAFNTVWNLCLNKPYLNKGYENSSRVFGKDGWDMLPPNQDTAVHVVGALNDYTQPSYFWQTEAAFSLEAVNLNQTSPVPPRHGQYWRINFSRVQWQVKPCPSCHPAPYEKTNTTEDNWVWAPTGFVNIHMPEKWGYVQFSTQPPNQTQPVKDPDWTIRHVAMLLYEAELQYQTAHGRYTDNLQDLLAFAPPNSIDGTCTGLPAIGLLPNGSGYHASIQEKLDGSRTAHIQDDRFLTVSA
eukprot:TRINITY_DN17086_c0_g1_i1.p1 TRINITY_DN17086_c0_g1~~TRINITY_DN17086_c0_g1_i1.p1  ORF type:complete len:397 (+),score=81.99 TRINITY_DN17086_c0_g1_i1:91-1281(+)